MDFKTYPLFIGCSTIKNLGLGLERWLSDVKEDPSLILSTHVVRLTTAWNPSSRESDALFWDLWAPTYKWCTPPHHTYMLFPKKFFKGKKPCLFSSFQPRWGFGYTRSSPNVATDTVTSNLCWKSSCSFLLGWRCWNSSVAMEES